MNILKYFNRTYSNKIIIYRLKDEGFDDLINEFTNVFRLSYISDEELAKLSKNNELAKSEFLEKYIIPDIGNVKSGDFGEIFSFHSVIENYVNKGIRLRGPYKWMWKDRNKPAQYTDVVLFYLSKKQSDLLITIESKMKATASNKHRIQEAIDGANVDRLTRLAKTLFWLEEKYARLGDVKNRKLVERFSDPAKYGRYNKMHKAIAIIDNIFEKEELEKEIMINNGTIVVVFLIKNLKKVYENTRQNIIDSVKENE